MQKSEILDYFSDYMIRKTDSEDTIKTYISVAKKFIFNKHPDTIEKLSKGYLLKYITDESLMDELRECINDIAA